MPLLPAAARRPSPWKNGGGATTEIAVSPEGADLGGFDWRISMARVERDGPFSEFPGVDRTLCVVEGDLILEVAGQPVVRLGPTSPPFAFAGDAPTFGRLPGGVVVDLNVMTRRGRFVAEVTRLDLSRPTEIAPHGEAVLIALEGGFEVEAPDGRASLGRHDAWRGGNGRWRLAPAVGKATAVLIELRKA
jgi:environmental stress-induced protein Ves